MDAILLVLRTGMQWNALAATGICNSSTAHRRFQEWERAGVFREIWRAGLLDYDQAVGIDWAGLAADGAIRQGAARWRGRAAPTPPIVELPRVDGQFSPYGGRSSLSRLRHSPARTLPG